MRDGQTGKGAGKLLKPAFAMDSPFNTLLVRTGRDDRSEKEKNEQQQINNKKCLRACLCMCMPFSGNKTSPVYGIIAPVAMVIRKFYLHYTVHL